MSRIRSIKPEFWTSAQILECSRNARLLFLGLWNFCDDKGRHPFNPKQIRAEIFPSDDLSEDDILGMLQELSINDLIVIYEHDNKHYFYVPGWHNQRIDKPQPAKYPDPFHEHSKTYPIPLPPDRIGRDRIGEDILCPNSNGSDHGNGIKKPPVYTADFESFWKSYPDRKNNSKPRAFTEWKRLASEDQHEAVQSIPSFAEHCRKNPDYRVIHCERYLSQRRFEGWEAKAEKKWFMV